MFEGQGGGKNEADKLQHVQWEALRWQRNNLTYK